MENKNYGFGTKAIHAGNKKDKTYQALTMPIYQTSTFYFNDCEEGGRKFAGEEEGYIYTRLGNPTTSVLEQKVAALEGAEDCVAVASGIGAVSSIFWTMCKAGDHVIADGTLYGCTFAYLNHGLTRYGVEVSFIDTSNLDEIKKALKPNTAAVYLETPANPNLKIANITAVSELVHNYKKEIMVVCDNTFATPYLQNPLKLGADAVIHSGTKYLNGHGDVIAGFVLGKKDFINQVRLFGLKDMTGAVMGPFEAFLILRGLKTFELRMDRHCDNAMKIANYLEQHPMVDKVFYPGLKSFEGYEIAQKQMRKFGGIVAFEVKGGRAEGIKLLNSLKLCTIAVSLGDAETLIEHPASMTHSPYSSEELKEQGISESLVRISVGLENVEDIIADLEYGFSCLK
ncbi:methionine gamma-lyase [Sedimentibacter sp. zth1]|uniref:methionine gamma-lyase n=1 Tax=Sedimentibacter sp. zth1 TaxID=2816908 RepID=UPI001A92A2C9|nr:methionine gamma-lyase [Sedimentibacter sp. zth1]QSX05078.1 methionine gamma-lyase [Sedimentibacter sp. zth1]